MAAEATEFGSFFASLMLMVICERMRSIGSLSKRGFCTASASIEKASSLFSASVFNVPKKSSRPASNDMPIESSSSFAWKVLLSMPPAPSSSMPESMLARPGLSAGSWAMPPAKAKFTATIGTA